LGDGVTFHGLKRKFVTALIRAGADIDQVRRLARHKSIKTTLDHDVGSKLSELTLAVNKLPAITGLHLSEMR
jgi:integrase